MWGQMAEELWLMVLYYSEKRVQTASDIQLTRFVQEQCAWEVVQWKGTAMSIERQEENDGHAVPCSIILRDEEKGTSSTRG